MTNIKETLELFNDKVNKLKNSTFIAFVKEHGLKLEVDIFEGSKKDFTKLPDEDSQDSFVLKLRYFIQNNESISLYNMSTLYANCPNQDLKSEYDKCRLLINQYLDQSFPISYQNQHMTKRQMLEGVIYTEKAHANKNGHAKFRFYYESTPFFKALIEYDFCSVCLFLYYVLLAIEDINKKYLAIIT
ncbi:MAG: hypothetical protein KAI43_13200 [Candidatus Aureabacteria bacterium]|nr:hypothetical protein [Candidatus Auribacterota bacterium]